MIEGLKSPEPSSSSSSSLLLPDLPLNDPFSPADSSHGKPLLLCPLCSISYLIRPPTYPADAIIFSQSSPRRSRGCSSICWPLFPCVSLKRHLQLIHQPICLLLHDRLRQLVSFRRRVPKIKKKKRMKRSCLIYLFTNHIFILFVHSRDGYPYSRSGVSTRRSCVARSVQTPLTLSVFFELNRQPRKHSRPARVVAV